MKIRAIADHIICTEADFGDHVTDYGLVVKSTAGQSQGIAARWFKVHAIGPKVTMPLSSGQWLLVEHGRWTDAMEVRNDDGDLESYWRVDPMGCLVVQDEKPESSLYFNSDVIPSERKTLY